MRQPFKFSTRDESQPSGCGDSLDSLFDEYFADRTDDEKAASKSASEPTRRFLRHLSASVEFMDIVKHYREHIQPTASRL